MHPPFRRHPIDWVVKAMAELSLPLQHRLRIPVPLLLLLVWAVIVGVLGIPAIRAGVFDAMSTDDAMRLVEIRDLLAGQGWFDLTQHRLDPPGTPMHWSRVVDAPLAGLILILRPIIGAYNAEAVALVFWPSLLLLAALWLVASLAKRASASADQEVAQVAAVILASLCIPALVHFRAGAIDHHNLQIILLLVLIRCVADIKQSVVNAIIAACAASLSLAIGLEMLPAIGLASAAMLALLIIEGALLAYPVAVYGLALSGSSVILFASLVPIQELTSPICDSFGGPVLLLAGGGGLSLAAVSAVARLDRGIASRLLASLIAGALLLGIVLAAFPDCVGSPYAQLDPFLKAIWLDRVSETMSLAKMAEFEPQNLLGFYGLPTLTLTLMLSLFAAVRCKPEVRSLLVIGSAALAALIAVSVWEARGAAAANFLAAPFFVSVVAALRTAGSQKWTLVGVALIFSPMSLGGVGLTLWPSRESPHAATGSTAATCQTMSAVAGLAGLPSGRVMAPIDSGPAILAATGHEVFAAPYHRNNDGNLAMINAMLATPDAAYKMLKLRKVDYVVTCSGAPDQASFVEMAPDGLAGRIARGEPPTFLEPIDLGSAPNLSAWRMRR